MTAAASVPAPAALATPPSWQAGRFVLSFERPRVMGIVNVTPDSFSDGGRHATTAQAVAWCERLVAEGADLLDIGGESTRPGARTPDSAEEQARVVPVVRAAARLGVPVSVDTSDPGVIAAALDAGADIVNDVRALRRPGALQAVAAHDDVGVCLMHMQGEPGSMQAAPHYDDLMGEVSRFLLARRDACVAAGIGPRRIALDPGIGFGKTPEHNLLLARRQRELLALGHPLLLGWSRKSTLGANTGRPVDQRLAASVAAAVTAVAAGAAIVRVHDVAATVDALKVWRAMAPA